ncbi:hypothetical protein AQUCO_09500041v1 [Aquilegia coerulea]|uniref:Uncharacterized protein n=1 Tax=Aquilegia coerulea TaxID=218851 RepID=A0A2G5C4S1_AQUCA|nr:hypothetical protein AQUCO_09500041v1 [Aquilegia coerulea]
MPLSIPKRTGHVKLTRTSQGWSVSFACCLPGWLVIVEHDHESNTSVNATTITITINLLLPCIMSQLSVPIHSFWPNLTPTPYLLLPLS